MNYKILPFDIDYGDANPKLISRIYSQYKSGAKRRKIHFDIPIARFGELVLQNCAYCGAPPSNIKRDKRGGQEQKYNGLDRLDSDKAYTLDNVVPCCKFCNSLKAAMPLKDWADFLNSVVVLHGGNEPFPGLYSKERPSKSFYFRRRR